MFWVYVRAQKAATETVSVNIEFRRVALPGELNDLLDFDRLIFGAFPSDLFGPEDWKGYESYWMLVDGIRVGCTAFQPDVDYDWEPRPGSLYIVSTGVLPEFQGQGLGRSQKEWQIEYARRHDFSAIVTNMRRSNTRIIQLNKSLGFKVRGLHDGYYQNPEEAAIVMELALIE